ncbi:MAG TPA: thymidylate synthase [Streptosporangiaceae bacterium]|nr:thymidylate synthase [Streptosporangiaceae bacterium]
MSDQGEPMIFDPLYYSDRLTIVNPVGDVGLVTLWNPLDAAMRVLGRISPDILDPGKSRIAVVSNLYGDGMYQMLCNLLYNPQIRHLIAVGEDMDLPTVTEIGAFLETGLEETVMLGTTVCRIPGTTRLFPSLRDFDAHRLQRQLTFCYLGKLAGGEAARRLPDYLAALTRYRPPEAGERLRVDIPPDDYTYRPSDVMGHQVVRRRPLDCWEELVTRTVRFGHPVSLSSGPRRELLNTQVVITDPAEDAADVLDKYGFSLERLHDYQRKMLDGEVPPGISYTYGNRLRGYFRRDGKKIDTLSSAVRTLQADPESRHAYISLWDNAADLPGDRERGSSVPCLVTLFFRRSQDRLTLTATYRSHNLLTAWLQNVYGLMAIQQWVCDRTHMAPGPITVISHSLGINPRDPRYEFARGIAERWTRDEDVNRSTGKHSLREDPNGYFVVTVNKDPPEIVAEHRYGGLLVKRYRGDTAAKIEREVIGDMAVSLVSHALWLGRELMTKAEMLPRQPDRRRAPAETDEGS